MDTVISNSVNQFQIPNSPSTYVKIPKIQIYLISLTRSSVYHVKEEETWIKLTTFNLFSKSHVFILTMSSQLMLKKPITSYQFIGCKLCLLCIFETRTYICSLIVSQSACSDITHLDFSRIDQIFICILAFSYSVNCLWHLLHLFFLSGCCLFLFICRSSLFILGWYYILVSFRQSTYFLHSAIWLVTLSIVLFIEHLCFVIKFLSFCHGLCFWKCWNMWTTLLVMPALCLTSLKSDFIGEVPVVIPSTSLHWTPK